MPPNDNNYETTLEADIRKLSCEVMRPAQAAYHLGLSPHPLYAWMHPGKLCDWKADGMVRYAFDYSHQARIVLAGELQPNIYTALGDVLKGIAVWRKRLMRRQRPIGLLEEPPGYLLAESRAQVRWAEYKRLVEGSLPSKHALRPFLDLGLRLGEYCFQLQTRLPNGGLPDFGPVRRLVCKMPAEVKNDMHRPLQVIQRKRGDHRPTCKPSLLEVFDGFIRRCQQNSPPETPTAAEEYRAMVTLDIALSTALKHIGPPKPSPSTPNWDRSTGIVSLGGELVRRIIPARAETIVPILDRFQAQQWPPSVPSEIEDDNIRADAVRSLNAKQNRIRFHARGENITWEITNPSP